MLSEEAEQSVRVAPSAPLELMWVMHFAETDHEHGGAFAGVDAARARFGAQLTRLRDDGMAQYSTEMIVLGHRSGTLLDLDLSRFFARIGEAIADTSPLPSLRSESAEEIATARARLERLRSDGEYRKRYVDLLQEIWASVEDEWEKEGRPAVLAESQRWARALADGASFRKVMEIARLWEGRPEVDRFADEAASQGSMILNPCWFGGKIHVLELDGLVYVGRGIRHRDMSYRKVAAEISTSIKALADPTRLAILLRLAREPASVTELARQFELSQPTVSGHVQILREAGLIDERTVGRSAMLSASEEGLRRLFAGAQESLLRVFRG
jgi:DNA-binding transcriptional ArsR family regulator